MFMREDILTQISNRIRAKRKEKKLTIQELADRANVTKGLISQVENGHTVPSLMVLIDIIRSLEIDLNAFFRDIRNTEDESLVLVKRATEYESFDIEEAIGFTYKRIFSHALNRGRVDIALLDLAPDSARSMVERDAIEYKYIVSGSVEYTIGKHKYMLQKGDSLLFDASVPHCPITVSKENAVMLIMSFFEEEEH